MKGKIIAAGLIVIVLIALVTIFSGCVDSDLESQTRNLVSRTVDLESQFADLERRILDLEFKTS